PHKCALAEDNRMMPIDNNCMSILNNRKQQGDFRYLCAGGTEHLRRVGCRGLTSPAPGLMANSQPVHREITVAYSSDPTSAAKSADIPAAASRYRAGAAGRV